MVILGQRWCIEGGHIFPTGHSVLLPGNKITKREWKPIDFYTK